jgi:flavin reductase (DIM6/NTAB) family NADH-FMN oxidoreductase RutF
MEKISIGSKPLIMPTPLMIVGSYDEDWKPNIATCAWGGVISHQPKAYIGVCFRSETYTHDSILCHGAFTVHFSNHELIAATDYAGIYSGKNENKIEQLGLTAVQSELVEAPIILEFPLVLECKLYDTIRINRHTQFIGEVQDVKINENCIDQAGKIILGQLNPVVYATNCGEYYGLGDSLGIGYQIGKKKN